MTHHDTSRPFALALRAGLVAALALGLSACGSNGGGGDDQDAGGVDGIGGGTDGDMFGGGGGGGGGPVVDTVQVEACGDVPSPASAPGADVCAVEGGSASKLVVGDILVPGKVYEGGGVLIDGSGKITCVGCDCAAQAGGATKIICPDAVVSPGLIDAHNHVGWLNGKPWSATEAGVDPAVRWEHRHDWRKGKNDNPYVNVDGGSASKDQKAFGELRYLLGGGTAIFGSGDLGGLMRDLDSTGSGENGLGLPGAQYDTFPLGDSGGTQLDGSCGYSSDGEPNDPQRAFVPHVAEGINGYARNEFLCMAGLAPGGSEVLDSDAALIHAVGLLPPDVAWIASKDVKVIWSPRSNISLYGETAQVTMMHRAGVKIALGGDWLPSGSMNMLRELKCADDLNTWYYGGYFTDELLWMMATANAAEALGFGGQLGKLQSGYAGDLFVVAKAGKERHRAVLDANPGSVALVLKGGKVMVGNGAVVDGINAAEDQGGCDDIGDVCGSTKKVCIARDLGKDYSTLMTSIGEPKYPLFFCDVPEGEPTCLPSRALAEDSINGSTVYTGMSVADDADGDGIPDANDNCPMVFNPVRPLDNGAQGDFDGDGFGDVCDACPLDPGTDQCSVFDGTDPDNDGIKAGDVCPNVPDPGQEDADNDGKGDACDPCPDYANPGNAGCLVDLVDVKTDPALLNRRIALEGVAVTAVGPEGYFLQKNVAPAEDHSGIFIYAGSSKKPKVGTVVDVSSGEVVDFFGQIQLSDVDFTETDGTYVVEPRVLSVADVMAMTDEQTGTFGKAAEEGLLVRVEGFAIVDAAPDGGPGDSEAENEVELDASLRLDDLIWKGSGELWPQPPEVGLVFESLTGPVAFNNTFMKLLPRDEADVVYAPPATKAWSATKVFQRVGAAGPPILGALEISVNVSSDVQLEVEVTSDDPSIAVPSGGPFLVQPGQLTRLVGVQAKAKGSTIFRAKVKGSDVSVPLDVMALDPMDTPEVVGFNPADVPVVAGSGQTWDAVLSFPAPVTVTTATLSATGGIGDVDASAEVAANAMSFPFSLSAADTPTSGTIEVTYGGKTTPLSVDVVDISALQTELSGFGIAQTSSDRDVSFPEGTEVQGGGYVIIARDADKAEFEAYWGVTLGANVVFFRSKADLGKEFPSINGDETFTVTDPAGGTVDGPSIAIDKGHCYQRAVPVGSASGAASWLEVEEEDATPGSGQATPPAPSGVYVSEICDASGSGNFKFEYVELHFDGHP